MKHKLRIHLNFVFGKSKTAFHSCVAAVLCLLILVRQNFQLTNLVYQNLNIIYTTGLLCKILLFYCRSLKCTRIRIHIQLFISFALNNIMWIIWYKEVVPDINVLINNEVSSFMSLKYILILSLVLVYVI